ncbi:MAG: biotin/lipoyl-binding protein [Asticcacaulis sp.]
MSPYITAETNGRVLSVSAQDGEMVTPGQVLAQLGNPDLTLQVTSQQADISGRLSDTNSQLMALQSARENRDQTMADVAYAPAQGAGRAVEAPGAARPGHPQRRQRQALCRRGRLPAAAPRRAQGRPAAGNPVL